MKTNTKLNIASAIFYAITAFALVAVLTNPKSVENNDIQASKAYVQSVSK